MKDKKIVAKVLSSAELTNEEFSEQLLFAEMRANEGPGNKLRFHFGEVSDYDAPIVLSKDQQKIVNIIKGNYKEYKVRAKTWYDSLKKPFSELYGYEDVDKRVVFNYLISLLLLIAEEKQKDRIIREVFHATFFLSAVRDEEDPILRAIGEVCGHIQSTVVRGRFEL